jgi:hypothetical protein
MFIGDILARSLSEASRFRQLTYTCLDTFNTRSPEMMAFPARKCAEGTFDTQTTSYHLSQWTYTDSFFFFTKK